MISTVVRRVGLTIGASLLLGGTWTGTAVAAPLVHAPVSVAVHSGIAAPAGSSGRTWCGFDLDRCGQTRNMYLHYGIHVGPLTWGGSDNTCPPEDSCNGYYFDWWD